MVQRCVLLLFAVGATMALYPTYYESNEESLKTALEAVTRKQRSLESSPQEYYDLHSFKYHGGDPERRYERERPVGRDIGEEEEEMEFLPVGGSDSGQLETVGSGFQIQGLNTKVLGTTLVNYLDNSPDQAVPSLFRERERNSYHKRGTDIRNQSIDDKGLAKLFLEGLQGGTSYNPDENNEDDYLDLLQKAYTQYKSGQQNKVYENTVPLLWSELFRKAEYPRGQDRDEENIENELRDKDQDQSVLYVLPAERRNVNGRFPLGRDYRTYKNLSKRYPVSKRSPKSVQNTQQVTDPKIARDLGALFGIQSTEGHNQTLDNDNVDQHDEHNHENYQNEEHGHIHDGKSSAIYKITSSSKDEKEKVLKSYEPKDQIIQIRKKNIDWSEYFGIDRRGKKAAFLAKPGSQNQDDEWLLQQYYKTMAEYLKPTIGETNKDGHTTADKHTQMDSRLKNMKDVIIEEALKYTGLKNGGSLQEVKDKVMARLAQAYSVEKMRRAFHEFRSNIAAQRAAKKVSIDQHNLTLTSHDNENDGTIENKRSNSNVNEDVDFDDNTSCAELSAIARRCKVVDNLAGDESGMLYLPCVILQICRACVEDDMEEQCISKYTIDAGKICDTQKTRDTCRSKAFVLLQLQPPIAATMQCRTNGSDSCLRRYHYFCCHRYVYSPHIEQHIHRGYEAPPPELSGR